KPYTNLQMNLGGLGPDYATIKEKKEKLKQQKEYAKQVQKLNMKNMSVVQKVDTKPKVVPPTARQKALEYAKKIPKPKNFKTRPLDGEVRKERVLPRTLNGERLPPIATLETLQRRHEKEKQVIAAFKKLDAL
ncbi:JHY protein, partial [Zapornia atra]|nr:JHY protein [Zapornia atra]